MKSLSCKVLIIFLGIGLFIFTGYLKTFGAKRIYPSEMPFLRYYFDQQDIVYILKNIMREGVKTFDEKNSPIEINGRFEHLRRFSKSEGQKIIFFIFIAFWGIAIIFVLGAIIYRIVIKPLIKRES